MALKNIDPLSLDETIDENKDDSKDQEKSVSLWEHEALSQVTRVEHSGNLPTSPS